MKTGSDIFAQVVAVIGGTMVLVRRLRDGAQAPAFGTAPAIPEQKPQGMGLPHDCRPLHYAQAT